MSIIYTYLVRVSFSLDLAVLAEKTGMIEKKEFKKSALEEDPLDWIHKVVTIKIMMLITLQ